MIVKIGNADAVEGYRDPASEEPERIRYRSLEGEHISTFQWPEGVKINVQHAFAEAVAAVSRHMARDAKPVWIECDNAELHKLLLDHYSLPAKAGKMPTGWGEDYPVKAIAAPVKKARKTAKKAASTATTMVMVHLAFLLWMLHQLQVRTTAGRDWQARVMGDSGSNGTGAYSPANILAVSTDNGAENAANNTLPGEITTGTMAKAAGVYGHTNGTSSYTITRTVVFDQSTTLWKIGLYNQANVLVFESLLNAQVVGTPGDSVQMTELITL